MSETEEMTMLRANVVRLIRERDEARARADELARSNARWFAAAQIAKLEGAADDAPVNVTAGSVRKMAETILRYTRPAVSRGADPERDA